MHLCVSFSKPIRKPTASASAAVSTSEAKAESTSTAPAPPPSSAAAPKQTDILAAHAVQNCNDYKMACHDLGLRPVKVKLILKSNLDAEADWLSVS